MSEKTKKSGIEREKKFLVSSFPSRAVLWHHIVQGYFGKAPFRVRINVSELPENLSELSEEAVLSAYMGVKIPPGGSEVRIEEESPISPKLALYLLELEAGTRFLTKTRWNLTYMGIRWEIDVFHGSLEGLITAEAEIPEDFDFDYGMIPEFIYDEITNDERFSNARLSLADDDAARGIVREAYERTKR